MSLRLVSLFFFTHEVHFRGLTNIFKSIFKLIIITLIICVFTSVGNLTVIGVPKYTLRLLIPITIAILRYNAPIY